MAEYTFAIANEGDDGTGYRTHTAWPPTAGTFNNSDEDGTGYLYLGAQCDGAGGYYFNNTWLRWDTSSIPDGETVTAAYVRLYVQGTAGGTPNTTCEVVGDYYDFASEPSTTDDWAVAPSSNIVETGWASNDFTFGNWVQLDLTDLTGISKTGYTGIRLMFENDETPGPAFDQTRFVFFESYDNAGTNVPELVVTTTSSAGPSLFQLLGIG